MAEHRSAVNWRERGEEDPKPFDASSTSPLTGNIRPELHVKKRMPAMKYTMDHRESIMGDPNTLSHLKRISIRFQTPS